MPYPILEISQIQVRSVEFNVWGRLGPGNPAMSHQFFRALNMGHKSSICTVSRLDCDTVQLANHPLPKFKLKSSFIVCLTVVQAIKAIEAKITR